MIPRTNRIGIPNRPELADANLLHDFLLDQIGLQLGQPEPTKRQFELMRQFTGDGFDGDDLRWGKKLVDVPNAGDRLNENGVRSNPCAICRRCWDGHLFG